MPWTWWTRGDEDGCRNDGKQDMDSFKFHGESKVATTPLNGRPEGLVMSHRDQLLGMGKPSLATTIVDSRLGGQRWVLFNAWSRRRDPFRRVSLWLDVWWFII